MELIDIIFWVMITVVVLGGLACLVIFLPREHEYEEKTANCYRIVYRDGNYSVSPKKSVYGENTFSLRSKYFYITKAPFQLNAFCDGAEAVNGSQYRAAAVMSVCFPEDRLQTFAPTFHGVSQDSITETLEEALSAAMEDAIKEYDPEKGNEAFEKQVKTAAQKKLDIFGAYIMHINSLKINENV